jgi:hypothetical protein
MPVRRSDDSLEEDREEELLMDEVEEEFLDEDLDLDEDLETDGGAGSRRVTVPSRAVLASEEDVRAKLAEADPARALTYTLTGTYAEGNLILHEQFGLGIVTNVLSPKKLEVIFKDGHKILVMNYTPRAA